MNFRFTPLLFAMVAVTASNPSAASNSDPVERARLLKTVRALEKSSHPAKGPSFCDLANLKFPLREVITQAEAIQLFNQARDSEELFYRHPTNGCYAIAHIISDQLEKQGILSRKVMIEGDLNFRTPYAEPPRKTVHWDWHVATTVKVQAPDGSILDYVIDPATEAEPLPVQKWKENFTQQECTEIAPTTTTHGCQFYFTERYQFYPLFRTSGAIATEWKPIELEQSRNLMKWYQQTEKPR